jgi:signal transduction histidine kinase
LIRLAEQLLLLARGDNGALVTSVHCDLTEVVAEAVAAAQILATAAEVSLVVSAPPAAPASLDPTRIRLAVENLLRNAITFAPPGSSVLVALSAVPEGWSISVRDHGPGFAAEFLPHAFERFRRSDPSRPRPVGPGLELEGAGLGLAIVHSVARAHGGTAMAANAPDGGAIVTITLPADVPADSAGRSDGRSDGRSAALRAGLRT